MAHNHRLRLPHHQHLTFSSSNTFRTKTTKTSNLCTLPHHNWLHLSSSRNTFSFLLLKLLIFTLFLSATRQQPANGLDLQHHQHQHTTATASNHTELVTTSAVICTTCGSADLNCDNVHQCTNECGFIKSINYPSNYGNNHRCRWSIRAPDSYYVNLTILDFDIPSANNASKLGTCIFDYLTLIDGYTGKRIGCYCNENLPPPYIVSPWNELIIQFDTNSETTGRGFYFRYQFMKLALSDHIRKQLKPPNSNDFNNNNNSSTVTYGLVCPNDWQYFRGSCYRAFNELEPLQWYDAEAKCNLYGKGLDGHLVSILDKDEMLVIHYFLTDVWRSARYRVYYIGLIDVSREGVYRWSDNNPMSYTDWELKSMVLEEEMPAQPDGGVNEDCTTIRYNSFYRTSNWHDVPCSLGKHFHSSYLEKGRAQLGYKWDYVNSYICKSDSISIGTNSRPNSRRPLFSNEFIPPLKSGHLTSHLSGTSLNGFSARQQQQPSSSPSLQHSQQLQVQVFPPQPQPTPSQLQQQSQQLQQLQLQQPILVGETEATAAGLVLTEGGSFIDYTIKQNHYLLSTTLNSNRYFVCDNLEVISVVLRCDGIAHCRDGSDESQGCDQDCLDWQFRCANGRCISIGYYCDFVDDCGDGSDESRCERHRCKLNEFRCQSGQCISAQQRCDLLPDCTDSSDEGRICTIGSNCNSASTFQCYNGNCIPQYAICDFQIDCPGKFHEDEDAATCELIMKNRSLGYVKQQQQQQAANYNTSLVAYYQSAASLEAQRSEWAREQNLFKCTSGNMIDISLRCLYEFDRYGYQIGCRDVSHLTDCADFECPKRDYVKCSNSYCIPWRYICDGKWDCIMGEDEVGCARYVCPGQYKCANQSSCILLHQLCDGHRQCPMGDDEWFCDLQCPSSCDCIGQSVNCRGANLSSLSSNYISKSVRKLDLSYNRLGPNLSSSDFSAYHDLGELILNHNNIEVLIPRKFHQLRNLYKLDLSNNQIHSVKRGAFAGLRRVTQLLLESNPELVILEPEAFLGLSSLQMLNISSSRIMALRKNTFDGLTSLRHLWLRSNMIVEIEDGAFRSLTSLVSLDMRGNEIRYFTKMVFTELKSLRNLSTDSFKFCCLMNHQIPSDRCLPLPDEISDCEDLLSSVVQRSCLWIAGIAACLLNSIVVVWRYRNRLGQEKRPQNRVNSALLLSLGFSDLLMGIYLLTIAAVDSFYRGRYIENADNWRESALCNLCGFLSTVSSEVSVFTLVIIAVNRFTEICMPFQSPYTFTLGLTHWLISASWSVALVIALLPLVIRSYFRGQFYARSGVCLAFHITNQKAAGWLYSIGVFLCVNLVAFVVIVTCYTKMYIHIRKDRNLINSDRPPNHLYIALIIITSFVAWSPTIILGFIALAGIALPAAVYSWIAVLVLPVNSAINPMIYTFPIIRRQFRELIGNQRAVKIAQKSVATKEKARLSRRNIPPGYLPLKQFIRHSPHVRASHLVEIALKVARDIEAKHQDSKVYTSLDADRVYVSDRIVLSGVSAANGKDDSDQQQQVVVNNGSSSLVSNNGNMQGQLNVFIADYDGYRVKRSQCSHQGSTMQHRRRDCKCSDVKRFGDILLTLIQLYNIQKLDQSEETKQQHQQQVQQVEELLPLQLHLQPPTSKASKVTTNGQLQPFI